MTQTRSAAARTRRPLRAIAIATGVVALLAGAAILLSPLKTAAAITVIIAVYALAAGAVNIAFAIAATQLSGWLRFWISLLGTVFVIASIIAFANVGTTTALIAVLVAVALGASWIVDGVVALLSLRRAEGSRPERTRATAGWTVVFAIVSILAGIGLLLSPLLSMIWLWLFIGAALVAFGVIQIIRGASGKH